MGKLTEKYPLGELVTSTCHDFNGVGIVTGRFTDEDDGDNFIVVECGGSGGYTISVEVYDTAIEVVLGPVCEVEVCGLGIGRVCCRIEGTPEESAKWAEEFMAGTEKDVLGRTAMSLLGSTAEKIKGKLFVSYIKQVR